MAFTETTTNSYGSRISGAFGGILIGIILVLASIGGLFWNEGRTVNRYKTLKEGNKVVVSVQADKVDPANEGKLIHLSGQTVSNETLGDDEFGVSVKAVQLLRYAEMYQWKEMSSRKTQKKLGGGEETVTTYSYKKDWSSTLEDSSSYKEKGHDNPSNMPYSSKKFYASEVNVGAFKLSSGLIQELGPSEEYKVSEPTQQKSAVSTQDPAKDPSVGSPAEDTPQKEVKPDNEPDGQPNKNDASEVKKTSYETKSADSSVKLVSYLTEDTKTVSAPQGGSPVSVSVNTAGTDESARSNSAGISVKNSSANISVGTEGQNNSSNAGTSSISVSNLPGNTASNSASVTGSQTAASSPSPKYVNGIIYFGKDPSAPEIGDIRVHYLVVYPGKNVSIVSQQKGDSFVPYTAKKGQIELLENDIMTADMMFSNAQSANKLLGWIIRIIGFVAMFIGFGMIMRPISVLADVVPVLGNIAGFGTSMISIFLSLALTSATIGTAWLFYRPLFGVPLLVAAVYFLFLIFRKKKNAA